MILDSQGLLSDDQAITVTAASTNIIDLGAPGTPHGAAAAQSQDVGLSNIPLLIQVTETFATLTSLTIAVQTDTTSAFGSPSTILSQTIAVASLVAGLKAAIDRIPRGSVKRYLRIYYTVTGSDATAGKITAGVVAAIQSN